LIILIITFLLTGLFSGLIAGLLGVGGGIIIVPVSYFILLQLGYSIDVVMHVSVASSLCIIVFTSISSVLSHIKLNNVDRNVVKKWVAGIISGSIIGSSLASRIEGEILVLIFISLAFLISLNMFFQRNIKTIGNDIPQNFFINFSISGLIGSFSALIGIGGGSFSVPILSIFFLDMKISLISSVCAPISISAFFIISFSLSVKFSSIFAECIKRAAIAIKDKLLLLSVSFFLNKLNTILYLADLIF